MYWTVKLGVAVAACGVIGLTSPWTTSSDAPTAEAVLAGHCIPVPTGSIDSAPGQRAMPAGAADLSAPVCWKVPAGYLLRADGFAARVGSSDVEGYELPTEYGPCADEDGPAPATGTRTLAATAPARATSSRPTGRCSTCERRYE